VNGMERAIKIVKLEGLKEAADTLRQLSESFAQEPSVRAQRNRFGVRASVDALQSVIDSREAELRESDNDE
jgi:hypothetical protein